MSHTFLQHFASISDPRTRQDHYKYIELLAKVMIRSSTDEALIGYCDEPNFLQHFASISDPLIERSKKHNLLDILFLAISAVMSGSEGWEDIEDFGHIKLNWLR